MTKSEILIEVISIIGDEYLVTEKYKELLINEKHITTAKLEDAPDLNLDVLLNTETNGQDWPTEIYNTKDRDRAYNFMVLCEVPKVAARGYRLRGLSNEAVNVIGNIVADKAIHPPTFIEAIQLYYKYTEMPKSFQNLLLDGIAFEIYSEHIKGELIKELKSAQNNSEASNNQRWT